MNNLGIGLTLWARYPNEVDWVVFENSENKDIEKEIKSIPPGKLPGYLEDIRTSIENESRIFLSAIADSMEEELLKNGAIAKRVKNNNWYSISWELISKGGSVKKKMQFGINLYNEQGVLIVNIWLWSLGGRSIEHSLFNTVRQNTDTLRHLELGQDLGWGSGNIRLDRIEIKPKNNELDAKSDTWIRQARQTLLLLSDQLISKLLK